MILDRRPSRGFSGRWPGEDLLASPRRTGILCRRIAQPIHCSTGRPSRESFDAGSRVDRALVGSSMMHQPRLRTASRPAAITDHLALAEAIRCRPGRRAQTEADWSSTSTRLPRLRISSTSAQGDVHRLAPENKVLRHGGVEQAEVLVARSRRCRRPPSLGRSAQRTRRRPGSARPHPAGAPDGEHFHHQGVDLPAPFAPASAHHPRRQRMSRRPPSSADAEEQLAEADVHQLVPRSSRRQAHGLLHRVGKRGCGGTAASRRGQRSRWLRQYREQHQPAHGDDVDHLLRHLQEGQGR